MHGYQTNDLKTLRSLINALFIRLRLVKSRRYAILFFHLCRVQIQTTHPFTGCSRTLRNIFFIFNTQVFQCLLIEGENSGSDALRDAEKFVISDDAFNMFVERHSKLSCLVPESNAKVQ